MVGWIYFWFMSISSAEQLLKPIFGRAAFGIACVGFPFVFVGLLSWLLRIFGRHGAKWIFITLGVILVVIGIWAIKKGKF